MLSSSESTGRKSMAEKVPWLKVNQIFRNCLSSHFPRASEVRSIGYVDCNVDQYPSIFNIKP